MDLLAVELPELALRLDIDAPEFLDRCESIASAEHWGIDRRREYAGPGYDQLNVYLGAEHPHYPMLRMVASPKARGLKLDVVALWKHRPPGYDEYVAQARQSYRSLFDAYESIYGKKLRVSVPRRPEMLDWTQVNCVKLGYAAEKLHGISRSLAIGKGDARERLLSAYWSFHVIDPDDLPPPLRKHLRWVYDEISKREPRYEGEGQVPATVRTMKRETAATILERLVDLADAIAVLDQECEKRHTAAG